MNLQPLSFAPTIYVPVTRASSANSGSFSTATPAIANNSPLHCFETMLKDLSTPYAALSDGELLQVVYDKRSLTTEAAIALDIEMRMRKQAVA